jgi:hypothetical protein
VAKFDPEGAVVFFIYRYVVNPYSELALEAEERWVGRVFFAVDPRDGVAISVGDLPRAKQAQLWPKVAAADREGWFLRVRRR